MKLSTISFNNLKRRKGKAAFLVLGLAIGVATVVALSSLTRAMKSDIGDKMDQFGANIVVVPKAEDLDLSYGGLRVSTAAFDVKELTDDDAARIRTIHHSRNISAVAPKVLGVADVQGARAVVMGVRFPDELRIKQWWRLTGAPPKAAEDIIAGHRVAGKMGVKAGDAVSVNGRPFRVAGVLSENGSQDDNLLYMDLVTAQKLLGKEGKLSLIEVSALCKDCPIDDLVNQIAEKIPGGRVSALRQAVALKEHAVEQFSAFAVALSGVVLLIGSLVVLITMMSSVNERAREIGIFRAIGFRKSHIMRIILLEALSVSVIGGALGWLMGMIVSVGVAPRVAQAPLKVSWDPALAVMAVLIAAGVGVVASIYPAIRAANLDPAEALRSI